MILLGERPINNNILSEDMNYIRLNFENGACFKDANILITGCGGFLGFNFVHFFKSVLDTYGINSVICLDNMLLGPVNWLNDISNNTNGRITFTNFDISKDNIASIKNIERVNYIIHLASIASPTFYRMYPLETIDANIWGLRHLLDFFKDRNLKGLLFFSSSELYGDPLPEFIPTSEDYWGNVSPIGPRACYDESKRFGETLCYVFAHKYSLPITIVRPFNNFGPGMKLDDKRVPADFANAIINNKDITLLSDGSPKRTFCYVADAIIGYLKALTLNKFDFFNIGIDKPEISMLEFALLYKKIGKELLDYGGEIKHEISSDKEYLVNNPQRRCPNIDKAKLILNYDPRIDVATGIKRFLTFLK